jgi:glycosyltransferase involved in cell wall biosynthesis
MKWPKMIQNDPSVITTIIPTYRRPERLKKAIQSVLKQTYPHFQVCIYDNASGDSTAEVVAEFAKDIRVKYHRHPENIGSAENFQYGLSRVETPFFSFLSDDDYLLPKFYETTLKGFEKFPEAAFSIGAVMDVDDQGEIIDIILSKWPDNVYFSPPDGLLEMIGKYSNWTGILFRRQVIEKIGSLDLNLKAIDVDYLFRAAACLPFTISKEVVAVLVQHPNSYSGNNGFQLIWPGWAIMISKINEDQNIPLSIKRKMELMLREDFINLLIMNVIRSISREKFEEAQSIVDVFQQQSGKRSKALLLSMTIKACKVLPVLRKLVVQLLKLRQFWLRKVKRFQMQRECKRLIN